MLSSVEEKQNEEAKGSSMLNNCMGLQGGWKSWVGSTLQWKN